MNHCKHDKTAAAIDGLLREVFKPNTLIVKNNSHLHKNHSAALAQPEKGHFHITITSSAFNGLPMLKQHRMVYHALEPLMARVHACEIKVINKKVDY